jgi:hypothetical protein
VQVTALTSKVPVPWAVVVPTLFGAASVIVAVHDIHTLLAGAV